MELTRRRLLECLPALCALPLSAQRSGLRIAEDDPANIKIAHRLDWKNLSDDDLLFLQQIGLKWARVEFGEGETSFAVLRGRSNGSPGSVCGSIRACTIRTELPGCNWACRDAMRISLSTAGS